MTPLASSNLAGYEYDPDGRTLRIAFHSGRSYSYQDVPQDVVDGLSSASSPGQYFNNSIKNVFQQG